MNARADLAMTVSQMRPGLWRWTAPHPKWTPAKDRPGGWPRMVGCVHYEPRDPSAPTILVDPLAPPDGTADAERFWKALDADVERRGQPVTVLLGVHDHERSAQIVADRYASRGVTVIAHEAARARISCPITRALTAATTLPGDVQALPIAGVEPSETAFWLPEHRALIVSDALIGSGPRQVRVAPESWAPHTPEGAAFYQREFRPSLRTLLSLPIELLVVSHGEPVTEGALEALASALDSPAWGD